jgi:hypothetical protein
MTLRSGLLAGFIALILALVVYNMRDMLFGAPLTVSAAADGATLEDSFVTLTGAAKHARELQINGRDVPIDRAGSFSDGIILSTGYNIVEVALTDRFGNQKVKTYHWVVSPTDAVAILPTESPYQQ